MFDAANKIRFSVYVLQFKVNISAQSINTNSLNSRISFFQYSSTKSETDCFVMMNMSNMILLSKT